MWYMHTLQLVVDGSMSTCVTPGALLACNDDSENCVMWNQARLPLIDIISGNTYYIVVDGYGSDMGDYNIIIQEGWWEDPPVFQVIDFEDQSLCGVTGWYANDAGNQLRDTDWFSVLSALKVTSPSAVCDDCETNSIEFAHPTHEYDYILDVSGISIPSAINDTSWGTLKGLFR
jgi:hypothetical protein